jgi:hypothetical protein
MSGATKALGCILGTAMMLFVALSPVKAQQKSSSTPTKDAQPKSAAIIPAGVPNGEDVDDQEVAQAPEGPPNPYAGSIKDVTTGLPILGSSGSPLRWGNFSIFSFEFIGIHDTFDDRANLRPNASDLFFFRTGFMFDRSLFKNNSRIVLQYKPQMVVINGDVHANAASNNNFSTGTKFNFTPSLSLTVSDTFVQVRQNSLIPENYFAVNSQFGAFAQNNFLTTNANFIRNATVASLEYDVSPRTNVIFSPSFTYMKSVNNASNYLADGQGYTGSIALGHALTPHRTVGVSASYQYLRNTVGGRRENAAYPTVAAFYSEQLARTFWLSGNFGATNERYSGVPQSGGWGLSAGLSVTKALSPRINAALDYTRGTVYSNYVTRQRSDRVDASLNIVLSSRIAWSNGIGYQREVGGVPTTSGKYGGTSVTYHFTRSLNTFCTFSYTVQESGNQQLLPGNRKDVVYGVRWTPPLFSSR